MLIVYLVIGAFTGLLSGLLGIGGGVIVVPALSAVFLRTNIIPHEYVMQMAIGTSLAIVVFTAVSGLIAHHKRGSVRWDIVKRIAPSLVIGTIIGAALAKGLSSHFLRIFFSVFLVVISLRLLFAKTNTEVESSLPRKKAYFFSGLIGMLSSILGIGGGVMLVPFLLHCQIKMSEASGTSLACGMMVGIVATTSFILSQLGAQQIIPLSTGFIYWPALAGVAVASMLFAPVGTALAHKIPTMILKKIFAVCLLATAIEMMMG